MLRDRTNHRHAPRAIALAGTLTILMAGCGGDGDDEFQSETDGTGLAMGETLDSYGTGSTTAAVDPSEQSAACRDYLVCIADIDEASAEQAAKRYGRDGSCWDGGSNEAQQCDLECVEGQQRLCGDGGDDTGAGTGDVEAPPPCAVSTLAPGAQSWIVAGEGEGELPVEIGEALERNCGCHLADLDSFEAGVPLYYGSLRLSTWDDFQATFRGQPAHVEVRERAITSLSMPPIYYCGDEAYGSLTAADHELLDAWLSAGAPDAPTWAESG